MGFKTLMRLYNQAFMIGATAIIIANFLYIMYLGGSVIMPIELNYYGEMYFELGMIILFFISMVFRVIYKE